MYLFMDWQILSIGYHFDYCHINYASYILFANKNITNVADNCARQVDLVVFEATGDNSCFGVIILSCIFWFGGYIVYSRGGI